ncbi:MAG: hypothetical protein ABW139_06450 [Candidatus Thiodiazotropha sp. DIVDIV]
MSHTLKGLFNAPKSIGFIAYNDEYADHQKTVHKRITAKVFWHLINRQIQPSLYITQCQDFPTDKESTLPKDEEIYG